MLTFAALHKLEKRVENFLTKGKGTVYNKIGQRKLTDFFGSRLAIANLLGKDVCMMPLIVAEVGEENIIKKVGGSPEVKKHLEDMGFVPGGNVTVKKLLKNLGVVAGGTVTVLNSIGGNLIVNVKEARVAVSREMAQKIMI